MLQGLLLPIAIGAGIGGISALARGESTRNVFKSIGLGALFAGLGGAAFSGLSGAAAGGGAGATAGQGATASFMAGSTQAAQQAASQAAAQAAARAPLTTLQSVGIGSAAGQLAGSFSATPKSQEQMLEDASPYSTEAYEQAYGRARENLSGIGERATYDAPTNPAGQQQALYDFQSPRYALAQGGIVNAIPKYREGGINYLPSKTDHNENDHNNYVRAHGYVEDGSGNGDKDEDTMLAQLADGEFVSRADAVLGAGIMSGANPEDFKDMRSKGAAYFYKQQDQFKRIYDIVNDGNQTS
tara:strand:- start:806 stop:1702 length:897 start_codon:yes stop_codon:yes gene_type:complete